VIRHLVNFEIGISNIGEVRRQCSTELTTKFPLWGDSVTPTLTLPHQGGGQF
jgi:hypothetical protein